MSSSPVLPYHVGDVKLSPSSAPSPSPSSTIQEEISVPPRSLLRRATKSSVHWTHPDSPEPTPKTPRTMGTTRTGATNYSSAHESITTALSRLGEERNVWAPEKQLKDADGEGSRNTSMLGRARHWIGCLLEQEKFHYTIIALVILDLVDVFVDLTLSLLSLSCFTDSQLAVFALYGVTNPPVSPSCVLHETAAVTGGEWFLWALSVLLLAIFVLEIFASLFAFGLRHFLKPLYAIDAVVVIASLILEVYFQFADGGKSADSPAALIVLRLWKIVRAIHAIAHSIELKNLSIIRAVREALEEIQEEHEGTMSELERAHVAVGHLLQRVPDLKEEELEKIVDEDLERRRHALDTPLECRWTPETGTC